MSQDGTAGTQTRAQIKREDLTLGKLLLENKLATQEEIRECLQLQAMVRGSTGMNLLLGELLVSRGYVDEETLEGILKVQTARLELMSERQAWKEKAKELSPKHDVSLGQLAIRNRLITQEQLQEVVELQKKVKAVGVEKRLGEILVERKMLSYQALEGLLQLQKGRDRAPAKNSASPRLNAPEMMRRETGTRQVLRISDDEFLHLAREFKFITRGALRECRRLQQQMKRTGVTRSLAVIAMARSLVASKTLASLHEARRVKRKASGRRHSKRPVKAGLGVPFVITAGVFLVVLGGLTVLFGYPGILRRGESLPGSDELHRRGLLQGAGIDENPDQPALPTPEREVVAFPSVESSEVAVANESSTLPLQLSELREQAYRELPPEEYSYFCLRWKPQVQEDDVYLAVYGRLPGLSVQEVCLRLFVNGVAREDVVQGAHVESGYFSALVGPLPDAALSAGWYTVEASVAFSLRARVMSGPMLGTEQEAGQGEEGVLLLATRASHLFGKLSEEEAQRTNLIEFYTRSFGQLEGLFASLRRKGEEVLASGFSPASWKQYVEKWFRQLCQGREDFERTLQRAARREFSQLDSSLRRLANMGRDAVFVYSRAVFEFNGRSLPEELNDPLALYEDVSEFESDWKALHSEVENYLAQNLLTGGPARSAGQYVDWLEQQFLKMGEELKNYEETLLLQGDLAGEPLETSLIPWARVLARQLEVAEAWDSAMQQQAVQLAGPEMEIQISELRQVALRYLKAHVSKLLRRAGQAVPELLDDHGQEDAASEWENMRGAADRLRALLSQ